MAMHTWELSSFPSRPQFPQLFRVSGSGTLQVQSMEDLQAWGSGVGGSFMIHVEDQRKLQQTRIGPAFSKRLGDGHVPY
jgi:hypothetical protein